MPHGGISRDDTRCLIDLAHGRASSYVKSDMGATEPGRWQFWQERCRMGATSLANVTCPGLAAGCCAPSDALAARAIAAVTNIWGLVFIVVSLPDLTPD